VPKILAVDDSATMRQVIDLTFRGLDGFEVKTFDSADQAFQYAESAGADLILADASMNPDGYELCRRLKANGATASIPVIILASQQTPFDAEKAKSAGADDHAIKPYDTNAFIDKVRALLATAKKQPVPAATGATYRQAPVSLGGASPIAASSIAAAPSAAPATGSPIAARSAALAPIPGVLGVAAPKPPQRMTATFGAPLPAPLPNQAKRPVLELSDDDDNTMTPAPLPPALVAPRTPIAAPAAPVSAPIAAATKAAAPQIAAKLEGMGLTADQIQGVLNLTREVIERVVWEVVPELAETIIREEIKRLTK